jgi:hypothetical protein
LRATFFLDQCLRGNLTACVNPLQARYDGFVYGTVHAQTLRFDTIAARAEKRQNPL